MPGGASGVHSAIRTTSCELVSQTKREISEKTNGISIQGSEMLKRDNFSQRTTKECKELTAIWRGTKN